MGTCPPQVFFRVILFTKFTLEIKFDKTQGETLAQESFVKTIKHPSPPQVLDLLLYIDSYLIKKNLRQSKCNFTDQDVQ